MASQKEKESSSIPQHEENAVSWRDKNDKSQQKRGLSPFSPKSRTKSPNRNKSRGMSPFRIRGGRGVSPFRRQDSIDAKEGRTRDSKNVLVCHESARSIVFRDHLRHAAKIIEEEDEDDDINSIGSEDEEDSLIRKSIQKSVRESIRQSIRLNEESEITKEINDLAHEMVPELAGVTLRVPYVSEKNVEIRGLHTHLTPLPELELGPKSEFEPLLTSGANDQVAEGWSEAEKEVFLMLKSQKACVKTIKNSEWPSFLKRLQTPKTKESNRFPSQHGDIPPHEGFPFNSFVTSTSLLPELGKKMRCFGSLHAYPIGVVFALPESSGKETEDETTNRSKTWSWPAGYAAKTEFNIDHGRLTNGREEALVPLSKMRQFNEEYIYKEDHMIAGRLVKGGFKVVPYNEVFLRVGGRSRIVNQKDCSTGEERNDADGSGRSFDRGVGIPVALFIRANTIEDIITLFRTRARVGHVLGEKHIKCIPLLLISNELGVRVFTNSLQTQFWNIAANKVNPFQNPSLEPLTKINDTHETCLKQKVEELIDLDENTRKVLTPGECARIAGGFGVTDDSLTIVLKKALVQDKNRDIASGSHHLQNVVNEGLASAVRSKDYYTARQLLILYSLVSTERFVVGVEEQDTIGIVKKRSIESASTYSDVVLLTQTDLGMPPEPPPRLDTDRLRRAVSVISDQSARH